MLARAVGRLPAALPTALRCELTTTWPTRPTTKPPPYLRPFLQQPPHHPIRLSSTSSSSTRWKSRQSTDAYTRASKLAGLKSRAAFKLLEINQKYHLFRRGDTVVDLGYAPGSWSQVAVNRVGEVGRVVGIDIIPTQPPRGVSTLQGDFLSAEIREEVRRFVIEGKERARRSGLAGIGGLNATADELLASEVKDSLEPAPSGASEPDDAPSPIAGKRSQAQSDLAAGRVVNVVLSDMCEPWPLGSSTWIKSVSNPWRRMMNTSGISFKDHAGSMDLCAAALSFSFDTLATGGNFLCKFYQGEEDKAFEIRLKRLFERVHRIKPESSRKESREAYFVGLGRRGGVGRGEVLGEGG